MRHTTPMTSPLLAVVLATGCFDPEGGELPTSASSTTSDPTTDGSTSAPPPDTTTGSTGPGETTVSLDDTTTAPAESSSSSGSSGDVTTDGTESSGSSDGSTTDTTTGEPACGNGSVDAGEDCDDGNDTDLDACTNACSPGSIALWGNATAQLSSALNALGEVYASSPEEWPAPGEAGVIIIGHDGATPSAPDYQTHLDAGGHLLLVGGSGDPAYAAWASAFIANTGEGNWHTSDTCASDWNTAGAHPMTALLPAAYEFMDQSISYHMLHFTAAGQPPDTELLGQSCEAGPNNYVLATRRYASGGTFTYMALDIGYYGDAMSEAGFVQPFIEGYLAYIRSPVP